MNKKCLSMALAAISLTLGFTSCGDDEVTNGTDTQQTEQEVQDTNQDGQTDDPAVEEVYTPQEAWGSVLFAYIQTPMYDEGEQLTLTPDSIFFHSNTWGDGRFGKSTNEGTITMSSHGRTGEYPATVEQTGETTYKITIPSVMGGTVITTTLGSLPVACAVNGTYTGGIYADAAYFKKYQPTRDQKVTITANEDLQTVSVSFTNGTWGTFTYNSVTVAKNDDGSYSLQGEGNCAMPSMRDPSVVNDYASDFTGTIADGKLVAEFANPTVMGGTTVKFNPEDIEEVLNANDDDEE